MEPGTPKERSQSLPAALRFNREIARYSKQKQYDLAELSYQRMLNSPVSPDVVTYNTMINVYVKTQRLEDAFGIFMAMKTHGIDPTIVTYTSLIDGCGKCGNVTLALLLYTEVKASALELNMHLFNAMMNAGLSNGCMFVIEEVMREIGVRQMKPNTITFNTLLSGYLRFDQLAKMKAVVLEMKAHAVEFSPVTQTTILQSIQLVRSAGDLEEFVDLLSAAGLTPSQVQGSQAVKDLIQLGRLALAQQLIMRLMAAGCTLTEDVFFGIVELAGQCANFTVLQWANETAMAFRLDLRAAIFAAQIDAFARFDDNEKVNELYGRDVRVVPVAVHVRVFQCFLNAGDERAFDVLDQILAISKSALTSELVDRIVQPLFQHDHADRVLAVFHAVEHCVPQFSTLTSDCIIAVALRAATQIPSIARLAPSLASIILLLKDHRPVPRAALLEKLQHTRTPPSDTQFLEILQVFHAKADFDSVWAAFQHLVSLGAVLTTPVMDLLAYYFDRFQSYEDLSFLLNVARDAGVAIPRALDSAVVIAAIEAGNLAGALAIREEVEASRGKLSPEAERKYEEVFGQLRDAFPARKPPSPGVRTRPRSRTSPRTTFRSAFLD
jgi:pentatricopeptide repeat protein